MLVRATGEVRQGGVALDVGCGHGHELALLAGQGWNAVGVDRSSAMLRHAAARPGASPVVAGDALALPFAGQSVDLVISVHGLVHLAPDGLPAAFAEIHRILRPGGVAATSFLAGEGTSREEVSYAPGHHRTFTFRTAPEVTAAAQAAGLKVLHARDTADGGGTTWTITRRDPVLR